LSGQDPVGTHVNDTRSTRCVSCTDAIPHADQGRSASQGHPDIAVERGGGDLVGFAEPPPAKKRSEARERLLAATSLLFYAEGINSVGIERIIKEGPGHARDQFLRRAFEDAGQQLPANAARHFVTAR
jgi:hypothetical protein